MATDLEKLVVQLSADIKGYEREMRKASGVTNRQAREIENRFRQMNRNLEGIGSRAAKSLIAPFAGIAAALGGRELIRMTGEWTDLTSRVNLAAGSMEKGNEVMRRVSEMARRTYSDLSQTAEGYLAFSTTLTELGVSTDRQLDFVESLNNALVISGAKGQTAERVMGALSKAMALGSLQGDNLNTVIESGGRVSQALAESMGIAQSELRKLGQEGKIGRREMLGISKEMERLRREAGEMPGTIQDGFLLLNNALLEYVGRGDDAVGMSARIHEALALIADNFETVADAGLKLAAVLAAAFLGRSIGGMIANLGAATGALVKFAAAMRAAGTMTGVATSLAGLGAVAGPVGALLAGVVAGGVLLYSDRAREAEQRSKDLRDELQAMGLYAPDAADGLAEVADAADSIGTDYQINRVRKLREGLEALTGSGGWREALLGDFSELGKALAQLDFALSSGRGIERGDRAALQAARDLFTEYKNGEATLSQIRDRLADISRVDLSKRGRDLLSMLDDIAHAGSAATYALAAMGEIPGIDDAIARVSDLRDRIDHLAYMTGVGDVVVDEIDRIIKASDNGSMSAKAAADAIEELGNAYPGFADLFAQIAAAIGRLGDLRQAAIATGASLSALSVVQGGSPGGDDTSAAMQGEVTEAHIAELRRQNDLSRERQDIEKRTERIMQDAAKAGAALTREQAEQLAIEQATADARRTEEGRSARSGSGRGGKGKKRTEYADEVIQIRELITALEEETAALNGAELSLQGYADVAAYVQKRMELLVAAKKQGLTVTPQLTAEIDKLAREYVEAGIALEMAKERHDEFEAAMNEARSSMESAFTGLITGAHGFRDALSQVLGKLAEMAASRAFDALWDGGGRRGSGGGIGGGVGRFIGGILGFDDGGPTPPGPKKQAVGIVHAGENVWSQDDIRRAGGMAVVEALRRNGGKIPGYEVGGPVAPWTAPSVPRAAMAGRKDVVDLRVAFDQNGNLEAFVDRRSAQIAGVMVSQSAQAQSRAMPGQIRDMQMRGTK